MYSLFFCALCLTAHQADALEILTCECARSKAGQCTPSCKVWIMPDACCMCRMLTGIHVCSQSCPTQQLEIQATVYVRTAIYWYMCQNWSVWQPLAKAVWLLLDGCKGCAGAGLASWPAVCPLLNRLSTWQMLTWPS